jgi:Glutamine amidotransferase domain
VRFCGSLRWKAASRPQPSASMLALLGEGAVDCTPPGSARVRVAAWSPVGGRPTRRTVAVADGVAVLFSGYLRDFPPRHEGEAAHVLEQYRAGDWSWLRAASGVFAFVVVDEQADLCVLGVDRLGIRPLFFCVSAEAVTFGGTLSSAIPWTASLPEPDWDTLQELMVLGFPLTSRTFLSGVERVPPGVLLEVRGGTLRVNRYWSLEEVAAVRSQPVERFLDEARERLRHGLGRLLERVEASTLCLLSSGYDSRRLLLEAHALAAPLVAMTAVWPYPGRDGTTIEPAVTGELCQRLGLAHRLVPLPRKGGAVEPRFARSLRDVLLDFQVYGRHHVWAMPLVAALPPSDLQVSLDGMAGDTFFNNPFYSLPRAAWGRWRPDVDVLDAIAPGRETTDRSWGNLLSRSLAARIRDALIALPEGPNRLSFFYLLGRTRAMVALLPYGLLDLRLESLCPYLDRDVMEHALSLDPILKGDLRLQELALRRHFPDFADIPSSHSPLAAVPPAYLLEMEFTDPDFPGRFTCRDLSRLLFRGAAGVQLPRIVGKDLAFAGLSAAGLSWLGGQWREPRLRDRLQAARALALFGDGDRERVARVRAAALAWLERWRLTMQTSAPPARGARDSPVQM